MLPTYVDIAVPAPWSIVAELIVQNASVLERGGSASEQEVAHGQLAKLLRSDLVETWKQLTVDILPVLRLWRHNDAILQYAQELWNLEPDSRTVASFLEAFRSHPDWPGLYACMHFSKTLRFAVCRDPTLRPLLPCGLNACLKWIGSPAGRQEYDSLRNQHVTLRSVSLAVSW